MSINLLLLGYLSSLFHYLESSDIIDFSFISVLKRAVKYILIVQIKLGIGA